MTLRRQLLLLLLVHLLVALAAWDGYRLGLKRGRAERLTPQTNIEVIVPPKVTPPPHVYVEPAPLERERWDANWRLN